MTDFIDFRLSHYCVGCVALYLAVLGSPESYRCVESGFVGQHSSVGCTSSIRVLELVAPDFVVSDLAACRPCDASLTLLSVHDLDKVHLAHVRTRASLRRFTDPIVCT